MRQHLSRCKKSNVLGLVIVLAVLGLIMIEQLRGFRVSRQIESLKVYMAIKPKMPDPANIESTGQWYLLDHISSSLSHFNHVAGKFEPQLATSDSFVSGVRIFTLIDGAEFSDGTKITSTDVVASIKRLLILRSSTHFPLWDYLEGCEKLRSMTDECSGLTALNDRQIEMRLKIQAENFSLQMSSPETGIWYHGDIDASSPILEIRPTRFSGAYGVKAMDSTGFRLSRNSRNPTSLKFPDSPLEISVVIKKPDEVNEALKRGELDISIRSHNPYDQNNPEKIGCDVFSSAPSTLLYLHGAGTEKRSIISKKFIETLWVKNTDKDIIPADNFLSFDPKLSITRTEFLESLPNKTVGEHVVKIGVPWTYLSAGFYDFLKSAAEDSGFEIELISLSPDEWGGALTTPMRPHGVDFVLGIYAASERYPAVQLRYITGKVRGPGIDLIPAESPEASDEKTRILRSYQKALIRDEYAVPLFFSKHQLTYRKMFDVGDQPPSDAEVELWRVMMR